MVKSLIWKHNLIMTMNCDSLTDNLNTPSFIVELLSIILNFLFTGFFLYYIKLIVFKIRLSLNFCVWYELQTVFLQSEFSTVSLTPAAFIDPELYWGSDDNPRLRVCRFMIFPFLYFYTFLCYNLMNKLSIINTIWNVLNNGIDHYLKLFKLYL